MNERIQKIRESQFVLLYGPGSIIESKNGSRLIPTIDHCLGDKRYNNDFLEHHQFNNEVRMSSVIRKMEKKDEEDIHLFFLPSNASQNMDDNKGSYFTYIFPVWHICHDDHDGLGPILFNSSQHGGVCPKCGDNNSSTNVRFVLACANGHLDDVHWHKAVHWGTNVSNCYPDYYYWRADGSGLADIKIQCPDCNSIKTMIDIYYDVYFECSGRFPEKQQPKFTNNYFSAFPESQDDSKKDKNCKCPMKILQKQSTSLRVAHSLTLLKMPRDNNVLKIFDRRENQNLRPYIEDSDNTYSSLLHSLRGLKKNHFNDIKEYMDENNCNNDIDEKNTNNLIRFKKDILDVLEGVDLSDAIIEEFTTLLKPKINEPSLKKGKFEEIDLIWLNNKFPLRISPVYKLTTVTAQLNYQRRPCIRNDKLTGEILNKDISSGFKNYEGIWYPAFEGIGEGIFITSNQNPIDYLNLESLSDEWSKFIKNIDSGEREEIKNPLFVWWHTLSHALINSLSLSCGYNSTSLKERIYIRGDSGGILIYNTSPGEDSGMGGLVETLNSFDIVLKNAMNSLISCSNDPLCYNEKIGNFKVNGAACHNCLLISETSCEHRNAFIDRHFFV